MDDCGFSRPLVFMHVYKQRSLRTFDTYCMYLRVFWRRLHGLLYTYARPSMSLLSLSPVHVLSLPFLRLRRLLIFPAQPPLHSSHCEMVSLLPRERERERERERREGGREGGEGEGGRGRGGERERGGRGRGRGREREFLYTITEFST